MKKLFLPILLLVSTLTTAQSYVGFLSDNYSGVHAVINNPANIVDSRYKTDINLIGFSALASNDYAAINFSDVFKESFDFEKSGKRYATSNNNGVVNLDILGPSFMLNIAPKHSIAISSRARGIVNFNNVNGLATEKLEEGFNEEKDYKVALGSLNTKANTWAEIGVTYATVLLDKKEHFLKGGLTLKYLQGLGYAVGYGDNIDIDYKTEGIPLPTLTSTGSLSYGYTQNVKDEFKEFEVLKNSNGFGADLGFTYEWRPNVDDYSYSNNDGQTMYYKDVNKYKLKLGLSITDLGSINYKDAVLETYDINNTIRESDYDSYDGIQEKLQNLYTLTNTSNSLKAKLPTAIHFNADWNINQKFYVNLDTNFDVAGNSTKANNIENTYSLTPRFESKWFSAYVPLSIYEFSGFNAGFGLRTGPLYVGSGSVITNLFKKESKASDVYLGLKIPIFQSRPKDRDGDGVFDKVDNCPKTAGPIENNGCPWDDKDGDGVLDNTDKCVDVAGPSENNGCPWGDKDNDGVLDNVDKCPETSGLKEFNGCPDTDGDGVQDSEDKCPKVKGDKLYKGCPADSDGDGIIDTEDKCPKVAGVAKEQGCPEKVIITKEAKKTINSYAKAIYFNSGKTSFRPGVAGKLDMIVEVLNKYPNANFTIEGHTDSQGSLKINQRLSQKRAKAVLDYFVRKGIASSRLTSYGFGEEYPIDTNKTRAGRANNRRVEIKLKK